MSNKFDLRNPGIIVGDFFSSPKHPQRKPGQSIFESFAERFEELVKSCVLKPFTDQILAAIRTEARFLADAHLRANVDPDWIDVFDVLVGLKADFDEKGRVDIFMRLETGPKLKEFLERDHGRPLEDFLVCVKPPTLPTPPVFNIWALCPVCGFMTGPDPAPDQFVCENLHLPELETVLLQVTLEAFSAFDLQNGTPDARIALANLAWKDQIGGRKERKEDGK